MPRAGVSLKKKGERVTAPYDMGEARVHAATAMTDDAEVAVAAAVPQALKKKTATAAAAAKTAQPAGQKTGLLKAPLMSDEDPVSAKKALAALVVTADDVPCLAAPFDSNTAPDWATTLPLTDPRPRLKAERARLVAYMDGLKKARDAYSKAWEDNLKRKQITARLAEVEKQYRTRAQEEETAYMATLSEEARRKDPAALAAAKWAREKKVFNRPPSGHRRNKGMKAE